MLIAIPCKASELHRFSCGKLLDSALCRSVYFPLLHFSYPSWLPTYREEREKPSMQKSPGKGKSITLPNCTAYMRVACLSCFDWALKCPFSGDLSFQYPRKPASCQVIPSHLLLCHASQEKSKCENILPHIIYYC